MRSSGGDAAASGAVPARSSALAAFASRLLARLASLRARRSAFVGAAEQAPAELFHGLAEDDQGRDRRRRRGCARSSARRLAGLVADRRSLALHAFHRIGRQVARVEPLLERARRALDP
jgi:hypothetical protein